MKLKSLYLILMLTIGSTLMAQDKYEQATVSLHNGQWLNISIEGKEFQTTKIKPFVEFSDNTPLIKEIASMRDAGWEVWNVQQTTAPNITTYYLRRKLK